MLDYLTGKRRKLQANQEQLKIAVPEFGAPAGKLSVEAIRKSMLFEGGLSIGGLK